MNGWPRVCVCIITYCRTPLAVRTIQSVKRNLVYPQESLIWHVADDGSPQEHLDAVYRAIEPSPATFSNAERRGVGRSMNLASQAAFERADLALWLEDDWELCNVFDLRPVVELLKAEPAVGMVRLGYISPGVRGTLITNGSHLYWMLDRGPTYTFVGHASLRHRRFWEAYGPYVEGLAPGATELHMCGTYNGRTGPAVAIPAWTGEYGPFAHIGGESLKDVQPEVKP